MFVLHKISQVNVHSVGLPIPQLSCLKSRDLCITRDPLMRQSHLGVCSQGEFRFRLLSLARCDVVVSRAKIRVRVSDSSGIQSRKDGPCSVGDIVPVFGPSEDASQFLSGVITMCTTLLTLDERACLEQQTQCGSVGNGDGELWISGVCCAVCIPAGCVFGPGTFDVCRTGILFERFLQDEWRIAESTDGKTVVDCR